MPEQALSQPPEYGDLAVVREVYDSENAHEAFEVELERALEAGCKNILIQPSQLGDETARWIAVGNCLHKTAVLAGTSSVILGLIWPEYPYISAPFCALSSLCTGLYTVSWQFDPCCKYQVETDKKRLAALPFKTILPAPANVPESSTLSSSARFQLPLVLVRRDDTRRKMLHTVITASALTLLLWRIWQVYM